MKMTNISAAVVVSILLSAPAVHAGFDDFVGDMKEKTNDTIDKTSVSAQSLTDKAAEHSESLANEADKVFKDADVKARDLVDTSVAKTKAFGEQADTKAREIVSDSMEKTQEMGEKVAADSKEKSAGFMSSISDSFSGFSDTFKSWFE
ncbi:Uncharacterised protein [BD1-7 clade bacterium]|uniref:Uncharacterized protein n=1 Tax=BD1-7 clade bacterium TaxID=2029982 RepID=A0A5S9QG47_9GAMM|nr:Uncharacterised protein [BD1-7 clade bacterium]